MDPTVVKLEKVFKFAHKDMVVYHFDDNAQAAFITAHDNLCTRKISIPDDEDRRGILSKARGQLARIAMILHCLEEAVEHPMNESEPSDEESNWYPVITETSVIKAEMIMKFIVEQKFALMQPEVQVGSTSDKNMLTDSTVLDENPKYLNKFLTFKNVTIQASDVSQFRLMPPTPTTSQTKNRYLAERCKKYRSGCRWFRHRERSAKKWVREKRRCSGNVLMLSLNMAN